MKRLSIRQAMINAIEDTDESLSRFPNQMLKWAKYIEKEIGSKLGYKIKSKTINVTGCIIKLPDDCYRVIGLIIGDHEDECNIQYKNLRGQQIQEDVRIGADTYGRDLTLYWIPLDANWVNNAFYQEVGNELNTITEYEGQDLTLIYNYNETDEKGYWIVNESHIEAISKYIQHKFAKKYWWKMFKSDKLLRQGHIATSKELEQDYNISVRHARAEDADDSEFEKSKY